MKLIENGYRRFYCLFPSAIRNQFIQKRKQQFEGKREVDDYALQARKKSKEIKRVII